MRTLLSAIAMSALAGFGGEVQAQCSELMRLRSEAIEATKPMNRGLMPDRCNAYIRASLAWSSLHAYAQDHQEACDISSRSLGEIEKSHHDAVVARDNVCAGRPVRPFPADVILR
ncbi:hypothetical protein ABIE85_001806 [Bradyrhizobium diazoefficiens]|jgi:hypothetical protein|uniref:hypothetical protein n=2 Tax=Bradyrhizobium diazoefficiens TaxID=1355477 RepID=UPI001B431AFE|nr:hypothetical protein [Bradyrhizobium diazoefficiens]MBP1093042.1 hypothetical protein [Bradyrhizobium japonicum]WLA61783.1 hypothetical protein QNN01_25010 [Bradyrhizobium diazoefficiens]